MRVTLAPLAEQDLESIGDYIAQDNPNRVVTFIGELREQCKRIADNPAAYRLRLELGDGIRSCAHGQYVIFFEIVPESMRVVRILHGARDLPTLFHEGDVSP
ncbi:MAG: type II toxin-antitoxin system RelE/ParE family toxin [Proteobacteria bacterium]|nr:type II toxin-antitoxin system RelE/ParE family toxin [Pseudomonadota bacterium]